MSMAPVAYDFAPANCPLVCIKKRRGGEDEGDSFYPREVRFCRSRGAV